MEGASWLECAGGLIQYCKNSEPIASRRIRPADVSQFVQDRKPKCSRDYWRHWVRFVHEPRAIEVSMSTVDFVQASSPPAGGLFLQPLMGGPSLRAKRRVGGGRLIRKLVSGMRGAREDGGRADGDDGGHERRAEQGRGERPQARNSKSPDIKHRFSA